MLMLSAGMQKAGSAWYFNLTNDLLIAAGHQDVREIRRRFRLGRLLTAANCNIDTPSWWRLFPVLVPQLFGSTYVVKTHEPPTPTVKLLLKSGVMKAAYIYRDPRDVVVSVFEHGERIRRSGASSSTGFDRLVSIEAAIEFVASRLQVWTKWISIPAILVERYEDLSADPIGRCSRLVEFLGLDLSASQIAGVVERYSAERAGSGTSPHPLHFNKGVSGRWVDRLSGSQKLKCQQQFGEFISHMGYEPVSAASAR